MNKQANNNRDLYNGLVFLIACGLGILSIFGKIIALFDQIVRQRKLDSKVDFKIPWSKWIAKVHFENSWSEQIVKFILKIRSAKFRGVVVHIFLNRQNAQKLPPYFVQIFSKKVLDFLWQSAIMNTVNREYQLTTYLEK